MISGASTAFGQPEGITVVNNEIFAANENSGVTVYPSNGNGDVAPIRNLSGANTGLSGPLGVLVVGAP